MLYGVTMNRRTLTDLVTDRIATAYGGNQAAFARAVGISVQAVNNWVKGKVTLPRIDARRRLAAELGIRHVDLFVLAGELEEAEVGPEPEVTPAARQFTALTADLTEAQTARVLAIVRNTVALMRGED